MQKPLGRPVAKRWQPSKHAALLVRRVNAFIICLFRVDILLKKLMLTILDQSRLSFELLTGFNRCVLICFFVVVTIQSHVGLITSTGTRGVIDLMLVGNPDCYGLNWSSHNHKKIHIGIEGLCFKHVSHGIDCHHCVVIWALVAETSEQKAICIPLFISHHKITNQ